MADVIELLRACDPAADAPPVADPSSVRARATRRPRPTAARRRRSNRRRLTVLVAVVALAIAGTALAGSYLTANDVFTSPDGQGKGDPSNPVHPAADTERVVETLTVPGLGKVELWAAGATPKGTCLGLRLPDTRWLGVNGPSSDGSFPQCFVQRDDPSFKDTLIPTGIDAFELDVLPPTPARIVYGVIDGDVPATAVTLVDRVGNITTPIVDGRWFAYVDPRPDTVLGRQLVAYDASGNIVTGEPPAGDPSQKPLGPPR